MWSESLWKEEEEKEGETMDGARRILQVLFCRKINIRLIF